MTHAVRLIHLFWPDQGVGPPYLADRDSGLLQLEVSFHPWARALRDRDAPEVAPARDMVLSGPRGNSKMVLSGTLAACCRDAEA